MVVSRYREKEEVMSNLSQHQVSLLLDLVLDGLLDNLDDKSNVKNKAKNDDLRDLQNTLWDMLEESE